MRRHNRILFISAAALALSGASFVALPASAAVTPPAPAASAATAAAATSKFTISVSDVEATNSSIDGVTLKAILSGNIGDHAADLAKLSATSIKVPEITVSFQSPEAGGGTISYVYKDLDAENVKDGIAESITVGSSEGASLPGFDSKIGKMSLDHFDIGGMLAIYHLVPGSPEAPLKTLYTNFDLAGASFTGPQQTCDVGEVRVGEVKARPLKASFADFMSLVSSPEFKKTDPSPEAVGKFLDFYLDVLTAVATSPMTLTSLDCSGKDDRGQPFSLKMGPATMGAFGNGRFPSLEADNIEIAGGDAGARVSLGSATMKGFDISAPLNVLHNAQGPLDKAWFTANARKLIPAFEGFGFSGLKVDVPDPDHQGQRINVAVGDFDLSLSNYEGGVPTTIGTSAHHIAFDVPPSAAGANDLFAELRQIGIKALDLDFDLGVHRDADAKTIVVDKLALNGVKLGSLALGGTVGNAGDALFADDSGAASAAAMALTLKSIKLDVVDAGLADLVLKQMGAQNGMDLKTTRTTMSGVAQGVILAGLGGTPAAQALGGAIGKFIAGDKSLSVTATAVDPAGLSLVDLSGAQSDPAALSNKLKVEASAQ